MTNINITNFRKDIYELLEKAIKYNEIINISTKNGNAIVLSEEDYNGLMETVNLLNVPGMKDKLIKGKETPLEDCIAEDEVKW